MLDKLKKIFSKKKKIEFVENVFKTNYENNCLFLYILEPFLNGVKETHQNQWQAVEFARIISTYGYNVDVASYDYYPSDYPHNYDLVIDIHPIKDRVYLKYLNKNCKKIVYFTGSEAEFALNRERERLERVKQNRKIGIKSVRAPKVQMQEYTNFDIAFFIGNKYNLKSYASYELPKVCFIRNNGYSMPLVKRNEDAKKNFLFFAGAGQLHKGLDLLLEVFTTICQDCNLYVCSPFAMEKEFCKAYYNELYNNKNIFPIGFMDIKEDKAREIFKKCAYLIVPSCSEGMMGSALVGMSSGIIPILTRECGLDEGEFIPLDSIELADIGNVIHEYASRDIDWINQEAVRYRQIVSSKYSREAFSESINTGLAEVLNAKEG